MAPFLPSAYKGLRMREVERGARPRGRQQQDWNSRFCSSSVDVMGCKWECEDREEGEPGAGVSVSCKVEGTADQAEWHLAGAWVSAAQHRAARTEPGLVFQALSQPTAVRPCLLHPSPCGSCGSAQQRLSLIGFLVESVGRYQTEEGVPQASRHLNRCRMGLVP